MNPAAKDPTPDTFVGIEASGDFSNLALESDILANIEAEKAAAAKATRDKRQKAAAADAAKVQAELKKQTMASAKSMKAGLDAGKSEKKAVKEPKVVPAAKPAAAAPKPTPVVAAAPVVVANDKNAEEAQAWIDAWKSNGSKKTTAAAESSSDSNNNNNDEGADEAQAWIDAWKAKQ